MDTRLIGYNIKKFCDSNSISPNKLREILNCNDEDIKKLFEGRKVISFSLLKSIADIKGKDVSIFFNESDERYKGIACMSSSSRDFKPDYKKWDTVLDIIDFYCYLKEINEL